MSAFLIDFSTGRRIIPNSVRQIEFVGYMEVFFVDYEEQAQKLIFDMIRHSPKGGFFKTDEFSQGEVKMLEYLHLIGDGITAGELSEKLSVSTARIARILKALEGKKLLYRAGDERDKEGF